MNPPPGDVDEERPGQLLDDVVGDDRDDERVGIREADEEGDAEGLQAAREEPDSERRLAG